MKRTEKTNVRIHPATIKLLTETTWRFARRTLWKGQKFSKAEREFSKGFIQEYYLSIPPKKFQKEYFSQFTEYCERVMLAKKYASRHPYSYIISHPCIWLNQGNPKGFAGTKAWYLKMISLGEHIYRSTVSISMPSANSLHIHNHISF